jgi:hypothetical protein
VAPLLWLLPYSVCRAGLLRDRLRHDRLLLIAPRLMGRLLPGRATPPAATGFNPRRGGCTIQRIGSSAIRMAERRGTELVNNGTYQKRVPISRLTGLVLCRKCVSRSDRRRYRGSRELVVPRGTS